MGRNRDIAEQATLQSFLNCYMRETGSGKWLDDVSKMSKAEADIFNKVNVKKLIRVPLVQHGIDFLLPIRYRSSTGRHIFHFPVYYTANGKSSVFELDYTTMVSLLAKEFSLSAGEKVNADELMLRVILSKQNIERFVSARSKDQEKLFGTAASFIESEQSLVFGHLLHPTPKSRQGIPEEDQAVYSPELKGCFPLHYFRAHHSIVREASSLSDSTTVLVKKHLRGDPDIDNDFKASYCGEDDDYSLIPVHPLQAKFLLRRAKVTDLIQQGLLAYLGPLGKSFAPTSSIRTVYNETSPFMFKLSLNVKITNSLRVNKLKELERGVEVNRLLSSQIGKELSKRFPQFHIMRDPAYITLKTDLEESGFEVVLRENPFQKEKTADAFLLSGLCQDNLFSGPSRLAAIICDLAKREDRPVDEVSLEWFRRYLEISVRPIMWLYLTYGIAVEAHQQNSVVRLKDGYPQRFFYRDNQGYYYCDSTMDTLQQILPGINGKSDTMCADAIADERLRYYLFFNNVFGLINAFGAAGLIDERKLLSVLREMLVELKTIDRQSSQLLRSLLEEDKLPCKGNLLTRFYDMDELAGSLETQSVYVDVENPLTKEAFVRYAK